MKNRDNVHVAIANLRANWVRSLLSMLGIVIGMGSVIVVTSIVNGERKATLSVLMAGTADMLRLTPRYSEETGRFGKIEFDDLDRLERIEGVRSVLPELMTQKDVRGPEGKGSARIIAVNPQYLADYGYTVSRGKSIEDTDLRSRHRVCLISKKFADKIFGINDPLVDRVRFEKFVLDVKGIVAVPEALERTGRSGDLLVPLTTFLRLFENQSIYSVEIRAHPGQVDRAKKAILEMISRNPRQKGLLDLFDPRESLKDLNRVARGWMIQMILIAGISLLVGGVGLMNVMLTTVAERTHEIGLRKAVGANSKMIQSQFLVESATLSGLGGLAGVLVGIFISYALAYFSKGSINVAVLPMSIVVAILFSVGLGVVFGLYPASKAAHMSPVEALRYE